MARRTNPSKRTLTIATLVVAFLFLGALNAFTNSMVRGTSLDLTEDGVFTLSPGTLKTLRNLEEPITLRFFLSPELVERAPSYGVYAQRVRNLLERYARLSDGKIRLEFHEPVAFSPEEDRAEGFGLAGVAIDQSGQKAYFGLAGTNSVDDVETIKFFHPSRERFVEYDLTRLILSLGQTEKKVVGLISGLPLQGQFSMQGMQEPWAIMAEIEGIFEVKTIAGDAVRIPEEVDVLMIVHPTGLKQEVKYAIDQYVLRGGTALVMVDPVPESAPRRPGMMGMSPVAPGSDLPELLRAWGVELVRDRVAADTKLAVRVNTSAQRRNVVAPYVAWLNLPNDQVSATDPVTQGVTNLVFASSGILRTIEDAKTRVTPLATTTPAAMALEADKVRMRPDVIELYRSFAPGDEALNLAVRITGEVRTAFPGGLKPAEKPAEKKDPEKKEDGDAAKDETPPHLEKSAGSINVIVVADIDMIDDQFWSNQQNVGGATIRVPTSGNADLVVNALDNLSGANLLMGLRGKGQARRPFTYVDELRRRSQEQLRAKEAELVKAMNDTREKLQSARTRAGNGDQDLTPEQQEVIAKFRNDLVHLRREIRAVRLEQRRDIEALDMRLKVANIVLIPVLIGIVAVVVGIVRLRRRRRRYRTT